MHTMHSDRCITDQLDREAMRTHRERSDLAGVLVDDDKVIPAYFRGLYARGGLYDASAVEGNRSRPCV